MCGIVGYIGHRDCLGILLEGLARLEYRGYDSAGIAILGDDLLATETPGRARNPGSPERERRDRLGGNTQGSLTVAKCAGRVRDLAARLAAAPPHGTVGIGHTRWATHGAPTDTNAHPHVGPAGTIALVHNGIVENYAALKAALEATGRTFRSQTDSEVIVHLIEEVVANAPALPFEAAARRLRGPHDRRRAAHERSSRTLPLPRRGREGWISALHAQGDPRAAVGDRRLPPRPARRIGARDPAWGVCPQ